jgi:hypothetical protein
MRPLVPVNATSFELTVSVSRDVRLIVIVGDLVRCAANNAGRDGAAADAFGRRVEDAVRASLHRRGGGIAAMLPVTVRAHAGAVEVLVGDRTLTLETDTRR